MDPLGLPSLAGGRSGDGAAAGSALALELTTGRRVQAYEEGEVRDRRRAMDEATAAMKSNAAG